MKAIGKLKNDKTPGYDNILSEYMKYTRNVICDLHVKMFNTVLDAGNLPEEWLIGVIVPLHINEGNADDPHNCRDITLLSFLGTLFTSMINDRKTDFSIVYNIGQETQAGFIDFRKAFDTIWTEGLW